MKYATFRYHVTTFHINICITGRNKKYFLVCGRVRSKKIFTRAVRRKQSYIFFWPEVRNLEKVSLKLCKTECRDLFNSVCVTENLLPNYSNIK